ncbi:MAG: arsenate reductase ArsC [Parvibaculaceae bacterium]|nr:arsenate reductase ArsC [Parvibaculaceae bacterium]
MGPVTDKLPCAVLFACTLNGVRSPMAEYLMRARFARRIHVASVGARAGEIDPFAVAVMGEIGIDMSGHCPRSFEDLEDSSFDLVVSLTEEAHLAAGRWASSSATELEYWPMPDPTLSTGSREQRLMAYREVRDLIDRRILARFGD